MVFIAALSTVHRAVNFDNNAGISKLLSWRNGEIGNRSISDRRTIVISLKAFGDFQKHVRDVPLSPSFYQILL